jgi:thioredoxin family protein
VCIEESPLLKDIAETHKNQPFALIGISLDEDLNALRGMVSRQGMSWPEICDGQGPKSELAKLFNGGDFPRYVVLDRDGKIVANHVGSKGIPKVAGVVAELLKK